MRIIGKKIGCALLISVAINVGTSKVNITEEFLSKKENVESNVSVRQSHLGFDIPW